MMILRLIHLEGVKGVYIIVIVCAWSIYYGHVLVSRAYLALFPWAVPTFSRDKNTGNEFGRILLFVLIFNFTEQSQKGIPSDQDHQNN